MTSAREKETAHDVSTGVSLTLSSVVVPFPQIYSIGRKKAEGRREISRRSPADGGQKKATDQEMYWLGVSSYDRHCDLSHLSLPAISVLRGPAARNRQCPGKAMSRAGYL